MGANNVTGYTKYKFVLPPRVGDTEAVVVGYRYGVPFVNNFRFKILKLKNNEINNTTRLDGIERYF